MKKDKQGRRVLQNLLNPPPPTNALPEVRPPKPLDPADLVDTEGFLAVARASADELDALNQSRPLGSVVHREPKSLPYSKVPDPVWKRKLRP